ncbi:hypothetical protein O7598_30010 [Micromonospora sp. WMMC241]|uniref:hypothetical protein n=1 Tax=Micromonospora sp. WMMC241 TaxID=3015159 RepID=UPI0022B65730|nr:hypothetical protein [Micromonospora sp. WMMC241]MCZ7440658.1 hypothetical protein [Micromonospora sp. WMMC241]
MSSRQFSEVDHDLLADYLGGALDGTPEQATVARLVEQEPAWAEAYDALARATDLVHADLAAWAAEPTPELPVAVSDRITAALAGAGPAPVAGHVPDAPGREATTTVPAQPVRATRPPGPASRSERHRGPGRRSRRWGRVAGPVALAAASVAAAGLGVSWLTNAGGYGDTTADRAAGEAAPAVGAPYRTTGPAVRSGTDWTPERFAPGVGGATKGPARPDMAGPSGAAKDGRESPFSAATEEKRLSAPGGTDRLDRPEALAACLTAIGAEHGATPLTVDLVDYARFQGAPALVVTFSDAGGSRWGWVSGPECGVPGSGADTRFRTRVG